MEDKPKANIFEDSKISNKPSITEGILLLAVIVMIIFKFRYEIEQLNNDRLPKNYWRHNYTSPTVPVNGPLPSDYLKQ